MKAFIVLPNHFDCSYLNGKVDFFKIDEPILYYSIDKAKENLNSQTHFIVHIEFVDDREVMDAVMCAYMGNVKTNFQIRIVETIVFYKNEAA